MWMECVLVYLFVCSFVSHSPSLSMLFVYTENYNARCFIRIPNINKGLHSVLLTKYMSLVINVVILLAVLD